MHELLYFLFAVCVGSGAVASKIMSKYGWEAGQGEGGAIAAELFSDTFYTLYKLV